MAKVLVVDDDELISRALTASLNGAGHEVQTASNAEKALLLLGSFGPEVVLTDLQMGEMDGIQLLEKVKKSFPSVAVILMTAYASIDTAVLAMKKGAYDYLLKPFNLDELEVLLQRAVQLRQLREENSKLRDMLSSLSPEIAIQTRSNAMQKILQVGERVAGTDSTILISGESGTGKTMLAELIHRCSPRANAPFAVVNCATLSENLLESELFGHVRGSFTGAIRDKVGRLEVAHRGTVFLDEIGEISPSLQTKLLRFLQEREFERVGDTRTIHVDVRVIAATNKDLTLEVEQGHFREDLFYRLNVIEIRMPPLRDRWEDLPGLIDGLLKSSFVKLGREPKPISQQARELLLKYPWPGNIRELKNTLERAAILSSGNEVELDDLPERVVATLQATLDSPSSGPLSLEDLERCRIDQALKTCSTLEEAASMLGIHISTLWRKRRLYGLE